MERLTQGLGSQQCVIVPDEFEGVDGCDKLLRLSRVEGRPVWRRNERACRLGALGA